MEVQVQVRDAVSLRAQAGVRRTLRSSTLLHGGVAGGWLAYAGHMG